MSFDWAEFLTLAEALLRDPNSPGPEEASLRSAISRAYYAAYCSARNLARDGGEITLTHTGRDHWLVQKHFQDSPNPVRRKIGADLDRLRDYRRQADYKDSLDDSAGSQAGFSVRVARNVLKTLSSL